MKEKINFKAVIIEASAGTGKTQWITNQFVSLIGKENPASDMRRILAITFSEKAAIEMKIRILEKIYTNFFEALSEHQKIEVENAMLRLRISTIHSFCQSLLKRFSFYTGIDPFFTVIDDRQSSLLSYIAFNSFLSKNISKEMLSLLKDFKMETFRKSLFSIMETHPYTTMGSPEGALSERINSISKHVSFIKSQMKNEQSFLDFNDLEIETYRIITEKAEALTILEDFDEKNNFIFVDEFQDTNILQWKIIHKFVEEWLSGYGAKAEKGEPYGIFLVGDRKQSIYKFRGAEGKVFDEAKGALKYYCTEEKLLENYRSASGIINFINKVFQDIPPWTEQQLSPGLTTHMPSRIEINILEREGAGGDAKSKEYQWVINKIKELMNGKQQVMDKKTGILRPINFCDIAILMRKKAGKNFSLLEEQLKQTGIPFVVVGGMGFYSEQEVLFLVSLVLALIDPTDNLSLWNIYKSSYRITPNKVTEWREILKSEEIVDTIEKILLEINFWDGLNTQQKANVEKFLMILDGWKGLPLYTISHNLRKMLSFEEEPKADIFSEYQNAVRVLTVHKAKGLEFPAVFLVNIEDGKVTLKDNILYRKKEGELPYNFILKKEADSDYKENFRGMLEEEELRVLYVALTRACQYLFISGVRDGKSKWIELLERFRDDFPPSPFEEISVLEEMEDKTGIEENLLEKINYKKDILTSYTEEKEKEEYSYEGTTLGDIAHKLMYEISEGRIKNKEGYSKRVTFYLKKKYLEKNKKMKDTLIKIYENIEKNPDLMKIINKSKECNVFSELPFITEKEGMVYTGFIDRIILKGNDSCFIYDYKIEGGDINKFRQQMDIYEKAVRDIFSERKEVRRFIIFLKKGVIKQV